jgi:WD40 repeat protein
MTQVDLGTVAMKVGGSVLSGMRSLGEKAYSAAMSRAGLTMMDQGTSATAKGTPREEGEGARVAGGGGGGVGRFFSRSAPAASDHERRYLTSSSPDVDPSVGEDRNQQAGGYLLPDQVPTVAPRTAGLHVQAGYYVTVLDLASLSGGSGSLRTPRKVAEFLASKHQSINRLSFSADGNSIVVSPKDGQVLQVFQLRPTPVVSKSSLPEGESNVAKAQPTSIRQDGPWHMYDLCRGRTTAVIEGVDWADDGRWIAIGTKKRTIHVFAVNPYGGHPDQRSHIEGTVRNYRELVSVSCLYSVSRSW